MLVKEGEIFLLHDTIRASVFYCQAKEDFNLHEKRKIWAEEEEEEENDFFFDEWLAEKNFIIKLHIESYTF